MEGGERERETGEERGGGYRTSSYLPTYRPPLPSLSSPYISAPVLTPPAVPWRPYTHLHAPPPPRTWLLHYAVSCNMRQMKMGRGKDEEGRKAIFVYIALLKTNDERHRGITNLTHTSFFLLVLLSSIPSSCYLFQFTHSRLIRFCLFFMCVCWWVMHSAAVNEGICECICPYSAFCAFDTYE